MAAIPGYPTEETWTVSEYRTDETGPMSYVAKRTRTVRPSAVIEHTYNCLVKNMKFFPLELRVGGTQVNTLRPCIVLFCFALYWLFAAVPGTHQGPVHHMFNLRPLLRSYL